MGKGEKRNRNKFVARGAPYKPIRIGNEANQIIGGQQQDLPDVLADHSRLIVNDVQSALHRHALEVQVRAYELDPANGICFIVLIFGMFLL